MAWRCVAVDVEGTPALLEHGRRAQRACLLDPVHGEAHAVDIELRRVPVGRREGELVLILELLEDLRQLHEEEARRYRGNILWLGERSSRVDEMMIKARRLFVAVILPAPFFGSCLWRRTTRLGSSDM